jgi:hypothetical protein
MLATTAPVVVVFFLLAVLVVFLCVARGVPEGKNFEIEVGLFPPKIRCTVTDAQLKLVGSSVTNEGERNGSSKGSTRETRD